MVVTIVTGMMGHQVTNECARLYRTMLKVGANGVNFIQHNFAKTKEMLNGEA